MKTLKIFIPAILLSFFLWQCSEDPVIDTVPVSDDEIPVDINEIEELIAIASAPDGGMANLRRGRSVIKLSAGSMDALQDAIYAVGKGGAVVLESGMHKESGTVTIPFCVRIIGEHGAMLVVDTDPSVGPTPLSLDPALHVYNASRTLIWGLKIVPPAAETGGTAILIQNSENVIVARNQIMEHQFSILIEEGDKAKIWRNAVQASTDWQTGDLQFVHGIIVANGKKVHVVGNEISNAFFGLWACDKYGKALRNKLQGNYMGVLLCKVPAGNYMLPDGTLVGAEFSGTSWFIGNNHASNNIFAGYVVIDGANSNKLVNNGAADNGRYDIELVGDSERFNFLTPTSFNNTVVAGKHSNVIIKDCGLNNAVIGGQLVDNALDPCF